MARRRFAPDHSLVAQARFIPEDDEAWDHDRIEREKGEIRLRDGWTAGDITVPDPAEGENGHPVSRYHGGWTRYDLDADGVRGFLDVSKSPETWLLKRLPLDVVLDAHSMTMAYRVRRMFLAGVAGLENPSSDHGRQLAEKLSEHIRDDRAVWKLVEDYLPPAAVLQISTAVGAASRELDETEKKPYADPLGRG